MIDSAHQPKPPEIPLRHRRDEIRRIAWGTVAVILVCLIGASLFAEVATESDSSSSPDFRLLFINTIIRVVNRLKSPGGIFCIIIFGIILFYCRQPRDSGTVDDGYQLLEDAARLERKGLMQEALAAYKDVARRYAQTDAGRDAQKTIEHLEKTIG